MESSKIFGGTEECHSSESGWTMYIGSPVHGGDDEQHSDDGDSDTDGDDNDYKNGGHDDNSDDSMASDASSGPIHRYGNGSNGKAFVKYDKENDKYKSKKKDKKPVEKKRGTRRMEEKEKLVFEAKRANTSPVQDGHKVRRNS